MKRSILLLLVVCGYSYGQDNEFKIYSNGLIYDESTMNRLGTIVDSLNIRFRTCDLSHPYYSYAQGMATWIDIPNKGARKLIEEGVTLEVYSKKYPQSIKQAKLWVMKTRYEDYQDVKYIEYSGLPYGWSREPSIQLKNKKVNDKTSGWVVDDDGTQAFYLVKLEKQELPLEYARLVQYVDCMIDTTAEIYFPEAEGRVYQQVESNSKAHQFIEWSEKYPDEPEFPDYDKMEKLDLDFDSAYDVFYKKKYVWDSLRILHLDEQMAKSHFWKSLLMEAVDESLASGNSDGRLEFYVARYLSKEDALKLKRNRKVIGNCSQDQSPRYHAMNICQLAAETTQWDIFLRSHLDIMNDRFERMSDGSYAWAGRKTYLKELEELDIDALDLLLGTSLRVENVSDNHYWGSINRVGRALADASDKDALEKRLITMMQNETLDPYNRLLMAYLFSNYAHNLEEENLKTAALQKLESTMASMPEFIGEIWKKK